MRHISDNQLALTQPELIDSAKTLMAELKRCDITKIQNDMDVKGELAARTLDGIKKWSDEPIDQSPAISSFLGDIYSGLQANLWSENDFTYADYHLRILSGLYGILRPRDGIMPYRLEMGYKITGSVGDNLYHFWGETIADTLPNNEIILNLTALEYAKAITTYIDKSRIITPRFLTISSKTSMPINVTVHTKIARGAFASWCMKNRIDSTEALQHFAEIGYAYNKSMSAKRKPVFVCKQFGGRGLSVRGI